MSLNGEFNIHDRVEVNIDGKWKAGIIHGKGVFHDYRFIDDPKAPTTNYLDYSTIWDTPQLFIWLDEKRFIKLNKNEFWKLRKLD